MLYIYIYEHFILHENINNIQYVNVVREKKNVSEEPLTQPFNKYMYIPRNKREMLEGRKPKFN
jgi:hypothetical protein